MSIHIEVGDKWVITSDQYQFLLNEKKVGKSGSRKGVEFLDVIGYYPKISQLISSLIRRHIECSVIDSLEAMTAEIERVGQRCQTAFEAQR
jgi:hypothetical protein